MRSSKQRSRNKQNRNRSVGNIVNRVFDSSGPEGKVRGTPQQIIDKYNQLARDAQLGGDRVATENFYQHAEHYTRMLAEAQREMEARREEHERQNRERQMQRSENDDQRNRGTDEQPQPDVGAADAAMIDLVEPQNDSGLVETPESAKPTRSRRRRPYKPEDAPDDGKADAPEAAE